MEHYSTTTVLYPCKARHDMNTDMEDIGSAAASDASGFEESQRMSHPSFTSSFMLGGTSLPSTEATSQAVHGSPP